MAGRGVLVEDTKRGRKFQRTNVIAAKIGGRVAAPFCYTENTESTFSIEWFCSKFIKSVPKGTTAIMDNALFHSPQKLKNLCRRHGIKLLIFP
jgi:transposase